MKTVIESCLQADRATLSKFVAGIYQLLLVWEQSDRLKQIDESLSREQILGRIKSRARKALERIFKAKPGDLIDAIALTFRHKDQSLPDEVRIPHIIYGVATSNRL